MKNLTTQQAILGGFVLVALAIASIPYSSNIVTPAHANEDRVQKLTICNETGSRCGLQWLKLRRSNGFAKSPSWSNLQLKQRGLDSAPATPK